MDVSKLDDPIWEYILGTKLQPYLPAVKRWWDNYESMQLSSTGVFPIEFKDMEVPPGLFMRVTNTPVRSPIKNVQAFPFVQASYIQITGVTGGATRMMERVCYNNRFMLDDFVIIEKHNLPSTYHNGQFLAFVPRSVVEGAQKLGKYMYLTLVELSSMAKGKLPQSVVAKCHQYIK